MNQSRSIVILTIFLCLFGMMVQAPFLSFKSIAINEGMQISDEYITRESISAGSNDGLVSLGFPGTGSLEDPILIEGYDVPVISFFKTDLYVLIRNCKFDYFRSHYSNNCIIDRCLVNSHITFRYSTNNVVSFNNVSDGYISLDLCHDETVTSNTLGIRGLIVHGEDAIHWQHTVVNNTAAWEPILYVNSAQDLILDPDDYGMLILSESTNCTVMNGETAEGENHVYLGACSNCTITNNSNYNFVVEISNNIIITDNQGSTRYASGVDLLTCENVIVANNTFWDNERDGIALQRSENCIVKNNTITGYTGRIYHGLTVGYGNYAESGINLFGAYYCTIRNNTFAGNPRGGVWFSHSNYCNITENIVCDNTLAGFDGHGSYNYISQISHNLICNNLGPGIRFYSADYHNITHNVFYNNSVGIDIHGHCYNATIAFNTITNEIVCINLAVCTGAQIVNNTLFGGGISIDVDSYFPEPEDYHVEMTSNTLGGRLIGYWCEIDSQSIDISSYGQVFIYRSTNLTFYNGFFEGCVSAIQTIASNGTRIENSTISGCNRYGIDSSMSHAIWVRNCTMTNCTLGGQSIRYSTNTSIFNCTFEGGQYGANIYEGMNINFQNCSFADEFVGLSLGWCQECSILDNDFTGCSIDLAGDWGDHTIEGNVVNGNPLGYFSDLSYSTIDTSEFGAIIIANCNFTRFEGGNYEDAGSGVQMYRCTNCTVQGVTSRFNSEAGVKLASCYNCTIEDCILIDNANFGVEIGNTWSGTRGNRIVQCTIKGNEEGIRLTYDRCTSIIDTDISHNDELGVEFYHASNVTILRCNITNNGYIGLAMDLGLGYNNICDNNISSNVRFGILDSSGRSFISNNTISDNNGDGVFFSGGTTIAENQIHRNNGSGVTSSWGAYVNISWNWICNNSEYGIKINYDYDQTYNHDYFLIGNSLGDNILGNALDNGLNNLWDDGFIGNAWLDWSGEGVYLVPGLAGSIDNHPWLFGGDPPERPPITTTTTTSGETSGTTTPDSIPLEIIAIGVAIPLVAVVLVIVMIKRRQ